MTHDNAGGGARGLRAAPSAGLLAAARAAYGVEMDADPLDLGGSANLNLLVEGRWVLRVYRPHVTVARLEAIQAVRRALALGGAPCGGPVAARDGRSWVAFDGRLVELERYVAHDSDMNTWAALRAGLPVLARIHDLLRGVPVAEAARRALFANYIEPEQALPCTLRGTRRMRGWDPTPRVRELADEANRLAELLAGAEILRQVDLPRQLGHGDFWDNNVLLRGGEVVFVTDFDFMGERPRVDDLALTLYFTCLEFYEERASDELLARLRGLVDAYDRGTDRPLSAAERAALPLVMARQPLWSVGGWVALLDDEQAARAHALGSAQEVRWGLGVLGEVARWQDALAG